MSHQKWTNRRDSCAQNPDNCESGFSFSIWARIEMDPIETLFNGTASTHRRYLLSTGETRRLTDTGSALTADQ